MKRVLLLRTVLLIVAAGVAHRAAATVDIYDTQPADRNSQIVLDGMPLLDEKFASMIAETIVDDQGNPRVKNATFLFQQCFGGGFLDNLFDMLPTTHPRMNIVAASASRYDEVAFGLKSRREIIADGNVPPPSYPAGPLASPWTAILAQGLANPAASVHDAVGAAIISDPRGTFSNGIVKENGQRLTINGDTFSLRDADALSFHAVLVAGRVDADGIRADIDAIYDALTSAWGDPASDPNVSISVLFGDGMTDAAGQALPPEWNAQTATIDNLQLTFDTLDDQLDSREQFFMYVADHGTSNGAVTNLPPTIPPGLRRNGNYAFSQSELFGYQFDNSNEDPWVNIDYEYIGTPGAGESVNLLFNDVPIGSQTPVVGSNQLTIQIPENLLALGNTVSVENASSQPIGILDARFQGAALSMPALDADRRRTGGLLQKSDWTGMSQDNQFGNVDNWDGPVPDGNDAVARFRDNLDGLNVQLGEDFFTRLKAIDSTLEFEAENGGSLTLPQSITTFSLWDAPQVLLRTSFVELDVDVRITADYLIRLEDGTISFQRPVRTNGHDTHIVTRGGTFGSATFETDFEGGVNDGALYTENTSVTVQDKLTAEMMRFHGGTIIVGGMEIQLRTPILETKRASLSLGSSSDPLPELTQPIALKDSTLSAFGEEVATIGQGVRLGDGVSTIFGFSGGIDFQGPLMHRKNGSVIRINSSEDFQVSFSDVEGAAENSPIYYATHGNDSTFADFDASTGQIGPFTDYVDINAAGPGDVAGLPGAQTVYNMSGDTSAYAVRLGPSPFNTVLDGGGNTLTTNSILVTNTSSTQLNEIFIQPPDRDGDDPNELITMGAANTQLTLSGVDIQDNSAPTDWTVANLRVVLNDSLTKSGVTRLIGSSSLTLNGESANSGGGQVNVDGSARMRLIDNVVTQDITLFADTSGPTIDADGHSRLEGDISINVDTAGDRSVTFASLRSNDSLTISGTMQRTGSGAGAAGQGRAIVNFGSELTSGPIITEPTANLTDVGLSINVFTPELQHEGKLGQTEIFDNVSVTGNGTYFSLEFSGDGGTLSPGSSIGMTPVTGNLTFDGTNNTYAAELTDDGQSDLLSVAGTLELVSESDILDIRFLSGSTLDAGSYTLATYAAVEGIFDTVIFDGNTISDPLSPGAFLDTHQLFYGPNALLLTTDVLSLAGDYNQDGVVNAADYTVWRDNLGIETVLPGENAIAATPGVVDEEDYAFWKSNFGATSASAGSGSAQLPAARATIPEPSTLVSCLVFMIFAFTRRSY